MEGFDEVMNDHLSAEGRAEMEARTMAKFDKVFNKRAYDEAYTMAADNPFGHMSALEAMAEGKRRGSPKLHRCCEPHRDDSVCLQGFGCSTRET